MAERETEIINHLLDVEKQSSELLSNAKEQADKIISAAKIEADSKFKEKYSVIVKELEQDYVSKTQTLEKEYSESVSDYKASIQKTNQSKNSFNTVLENFLFSTAN